jgi:GT2 family glycosyltransferase
MLDLSVIVFTDPVHDNSASQYLRCLPTQTLSHTRFEVLIADNCDRVEFAHAVDAMRAECPALDIRYLRIAKTGRAAALNAALDASSAPLVAIIADDILPEPTALQAFLDFHRANPDPLAVAIGPTMFREALRCDPLRRWLEDSGTLFGVSLRQIYPFWPRNFFFAGNSCLKRETIERLGRFDERFPWITWDDYEFSQRWLAAGGYSQLVNGALAWHEHWITLEERAGAMRRGGHAAHIHETQIGAKTRPWHAWLERARANRHRPLRRDDERLPLAQRVPIFEATFDRAFLEGYEAEARGDRSDLQGLIAST